MPDRWHNAKILIFRGSVLGGRSVTLRLANQPESSINIPYDIDDTEGDITAATRTGRFEFSAIDTTATVTITAVDDDKIEPPENFTLTLDSGPHNGIFVSEGGPHSTAAITILDDDGIIVSLQANPSSITEVATGGNSTVVTLRLANQPESSINIPYDIDDTEGDITAATRTGRFEFSAIDTTATVTITAVDDDKIEPPENFTLTLDSGPHNGIFVSEGDPHSTAAITILDDDGIIVSLQANPSSITEVATGGNSTVVTLRLANQPESSITIPYNIDDTEGDITAATRTGRFEFSATDTTATVTITAVDDDKIEPPEDYTLTLTSGAHNGIFVSEGGPHSTAAITILDDDGIIVSLQANPSSITEGATGGNSTVVTLRLGGQAQSPITIPYTIIPDPGMDITTASTGTFNFNTTDTTATVTITAVDDDKIEPPEHFTLTLKPGAHNGIFVSEGDLHSTVAIIILDDDGIRVRVRVFLEGPLR